MGPSETPPDYRKPLAASHPGFPRWTGAQAGRYALEWEQAELDRLVADIFGYHALQLGLPVLEGLRANRMPSRWCLSNHGEGQSPHAVSIQADFHSLPFPSSSLDLVVMPHTLESTADPHQTLREVERVLRPEGRIVVTGFNPASLWGVARRLRSGPWRAGSSVAGDSAAPPPSDAEVTEGEWVGYWRLRDWLRLLSFEVEGGRFGCYVPPVASDRWRERLSWLDPVGDRWWPVLGSVYALVAVKRVRGMRMLGLSRRTKRITAAAPAVVTQRHPRNLPRQGDVR